MDLSTFSTNSAWVWGVFTRFLGLALCINFLSVLPQLQALVGSSGLEPAAWLFAAVKRDLGLLERFLRFPSIFLVDSSDRFLSFICCAGLVASAAIVIGGTLTPVFFFLAWCCWLSIQVSDPTLFSFPWDLLLSECALGGIFLPPLATLPDIQSMWPPHPAVVIYFNWLLFRVIFGMGFTRFKRLGETERNLSYIYHFLQWQPMPTPFAYHMRSLPMLAHKVSFLFLFWAEVIAVFGIFGSMPLRFIAMISIGLLQVGIWATGNYGTFNLLTLILCLPLLLPLPGLTDLFPSGAPTTSTLLSLFLCAFVVISLPSILVANFWTGTLWVYQRSALRESRLCLLLEPVAALLRFLAPFRLVNSYGVFRYQEIYVRDRLITRLQGSDGNGWRNYDTKFLSSRPDWRPRFFAPYHPRLDHYLFYGLCEAHSLKWFMLMACNPYYFHPFCLTEKIVQKLLRNDPVALSLFKHNPFPNEPPKYVRYTLYRYRFTTPAEKRENGRWWNVECLGTSDPITLLPIDENSGIRSSYDRFISETQSKGTFVAREFVDPGSGEKIRMHIHEIRRTGMVPIQSAGEGALKSSTTARLAALFRTVLSAPTAGRAIDDPYARVFLDTPMRLLAPLLIPSVIRGLDHGLAGLFTVVAARTHFFDDALRKAIAAGIRQVVILGAGYDSRALRLGQTGVRFFELDLPATQAKKRVRLPGVENVAGTIFVPLDFTNADLAAALERAGHDRQSPTFFLWEGGTMYLQKHHVRHTLRAIASASPAGSELAFDAAARSLEAFSRGQRALGVVARGIVAAFGEPLGFLTDPGGLCALLDEEGFTVREIRGTEELFTRYLTASFLKNPRQPLEYAVLASRKQH